MTLHALRFTRERLQKLHGKRVAFSITRDGVFEVTAANESASEHPVDEIQWMFVFAIAAVGLFVFVSDGGKDTAAVVVTCVLAGLSVALLVHVLRTTSVVTLATRDGKIRVAVGAKLPESELSELMYRVHDELGWPARGGLRLKARGRRRSSSKKKVGSER